VPLHLVTGSLDVDAFVRGTLSCPERRRVMAHLLRRCPDCQEALARYAGYAGIGVGAVDHRQRDEGYDASIARAFERARHVVEAQVVASGILETFLVDERPGAILSLQEAARLRGVHRVATLLDVSRSQRHADPARMLQGARLACSTAAKMTAELYSGKLAADFRALTWAELGNAYRIADDLWRSSRAMDCAIYWCRRGSRQPLLQAYVSDLVASLLSHQRRFAEGRQLLSKVYEIYQDAGLQHLAGRTLVKAGQLAGYAGSPGEALRLMSRGLALLDQGRQPRMAAQTLQSMLWFLVDLGHFRSARRRLWHSRWLLVENAHRLDLLRLRWLEGRIYAGLGDLARAETAFQETRAGFAETRQFYPAALAGLDLAALWARQGRVREIYDLAGELITSFRTLRIAREAVATLVLLQRACAVGDQVEAFIESAATLLHELDRQPVKGVKPVNPAGPPRP
jgi:tetratricopeptide (TPR) repeat protein